MALESSIDLTGLQEDLCRISHKRYFFNVAWCMRNLPLPSPLFLFVVLFKMFFLFTFIVCDWRDQKITHATYFSLGPPSSTFLSWDSSLCWDSGHAPVHPVQKEVLEFSAGRSSSAVCLSGVLSNSLQGVLALVGRLPFFTAVFPRLEQMSESPKGMTDN